MNYDVKTGAESIWLAVQTAVAALVGWGLTFTGMDTITIVIVAGAVGSAARPVLGYLLRFLPQPSAAGGRISAGLAIALAVLAMFAVGASQADAAPPQKYTVVHVTGAHTINGPCAPLWTPKLLAYASTDCNVADGTLVARNATPGTVHARIDTTLTYPEYVSNGP